jgi:branched-chain amino acid transport system ATP-binding protein/neutral amino acid transport system ATP-binding protein
MIAAEHLVCGYGPGEEIVKGVDFALGAAELVAVIGPNGAGKSTFLKALAGLLPAGSGRVTLGGEDVTALDARGRASRGLGFVPQEANVFPSLSVWENLEIGANLARAHEAERIAAMFARFPVLAEKRRAAARTLSGGQRQVLAMAIALMAAPRVLLLDEPSAGLSPVAATLLFETITAIHAEATPVLLVEQNAEAALAIADRGVVLVDGRIAHVGPAAAMAADPEIRRLFLGG